MKRRIISFTLAICLALCLTLSAFGAASLSNFAILRTYEDQFTDVSPDDWFYDGVRNAYEYGIIDGTSDDTFDPTESLTIAQTIKLAAFLHKGYYTGEMGFDEGSPWFDVYVDYALDNGIIGGTYSNYNAAATRSDFVIIIAGAMPEEALTPINRIADGAIPDVMEYYSYGYDVYLLYRAGILTGMDSEGTFNPSRTLRRSEAATMVARILKAELRQSFNLANPLTAEQIYKMASPAVFYVEMFDSDGRLFKTGSGFFISASGLAVTNFHVIFGGYDAKVTLDNGEVYDVLGVYDYVGKQDMALIQVDIENAPYLICADSSAIQTGERVYALGSPLGLQGSFSEGIVSQALRQIEGVEYIQLDASISSGSSGGALLDAAGRVIGVTSATVVSGQNLNLAMPINILNSLSRDSYISLTEIIESTAYYPGYFPVPDFGAYFGADVFSTQSSWSGDTYSYLLSDLPGDIEEIIDEYCLLLEQNMFDYQGAEGTEDEPGFRFHYHYEYYIVVRHGIDVVRGQDCYTIIIS